MLTEEAKYLSDYINSLGEEHFPMFQIQPKVSNLLLIKDSGYASKPY
jgi:hypothetical protein